MNAEREGKGAKPSSQQPKAPRAPKPPREGRPARDADAAKEAKDAAPAEPEKPAAPARLRVHYREAVVPDLTRQFGYKTVMQVPRIEKIVLNMGVGEAVADKKVMDNAVADMTKIAGQKPIVTKARKSIAQFKIRNGYPGNYNMGVKEQIIFPEIEYDKIDVLRGMNITISTTAKTDAEAKALLAAFKFPFRN